MMALPIIAYVIIVMKNIKNYNNELGFLTMITVDASIEFVRQLERMMN